jgi:DNA-binding PucR family transcriptional regulator
LCRANQVERAIHNHAAKQATLAPVRDHRSEVEYYFNAIHSSAQRREISHIAYHKRELQVSDILEIARLPDKTADRLLVREQLLDEMASDKPIRACHEKHK